MDNCEQSGSNTQIKYALDRLVAPIVFILLSPVLCAIAVAIKLDDGRPIFFRQERLGLHAKTFVIWKFRTMVPDADRFLDASGTADKSVQRITRVGRLLRATSLDELPQIMNIVTGDMSFIGPRPVLPAHLDRYTEEQKLRLCMKPGITGLAQTRGRNQLLWSKRIEYDVEYIRNYSLWLDIKILLRTIRTVALREGIVLDRNPEQIDDLGPEQI